MFKFIINNSICFLIFVTINKFCLANTSYGTSALASITTGSNNSAFGQNALNNNTSGGTNNAFGYNALGSNTTGTVNTAVGSWSLFSNISGDNNNALGYKSMILNTTGENNTASGSHSLESNISGSNNVSLGYKSGFSNATGSGNVFIGNQAGYNETGSNKLYIDNSNTSNPLIYGDFDNDIVTFNGKLSVTGDISGNKLTDTSGNTILNTNSGNVLLGNLAGYNETGSNKLYIDNSNTSNPLIYGDFDNDKVTINGDMSVTGELRATKITDTSGKSIIRTDSTTGGIHIGTNSMVFYDATSATGNGKDIMTSSTGNIQIGTNDSDITTFKGSVNIPDPTKPTHASSKRYVDSIGAMSMAMSSSLTPRGEGNYLGFGAGVVDGQSAISTSLSIVDDKKLVNISLGYNNLVETPSISGGISWKF